MTICYCCSFIVPSSTGATTLESFLYNYAVDLCRKYRDEPVMYSYPVSQLVGNLYYFDPVDDWHFAVDAIIRGIKKYVTRFECVDDEVRMSVEMDPYTLDHPNDESLFDSILTYLLIRTRVPLALVYTAERDLDCYEDYSALHTVIVNTGNSVRYFDSYSHLFRELLSHPQFKFSSFLVNSGPM
jgi:hypothetical protein